MNAHTSLPRAWFFVSALVALAVGQACSGSSTPQNGFDTGSGNGTNDGNGTGTGSGNNGTPGGPTFGGPSDAGVGAGDDAAADGCPESATLVYVTGVGSKLYSFYPPTQTFTLVGTLDCLSSPTHMTVDRQGVAWVVSDGKIYKASTADASCSAVSSWKTNNSFSDFALTFIGVQNTIDNTLYLMNDSAALGSFDISTGILTPIGNANIPSTLGDMTSNGDGTLYFLRDVASPTLYNVNPTTAAIIGSSSIMASGGGSQALAFWGGSFYAFENDTIYQFDPVMKTSKQIGTAPLEVTGAGQSTCVPKVPPPTK